MTAACINIHLNDEAPILVAIDEDFSSIISDYPSITVDQLSVLALLSTVFNIRTNTYWMRNMPWVPLTSTFSLNIGELVDSTTDLSHPSNSLTIYTYTGQSLKNSFKKEYPFDYDGTEAQWNALVESTPFENMTEVMSNYFPGTFSFNKTPLRVSFSSPRASEIQTYISDKGIADPFYNDGYLLLKEFVGRTPNGYSKPSSSPVVVNTLNGREVVSFETQVFLSVNLQDPGLPSNGAPEGGYPKTYLNIDLPGRNYPPL